MIQGRDIICFSTADWDTALPTNKHQIMTRLARWNRVLFVETLGTRTVRWSSGTDVSRVGRRLKRAFGGPRRVHPVFWPVGKSRRSDESGDEKAMAGRFSRRAGLWVLSPVVMPRWESPWVSLANRVALRFQIRRAVDRLGFRRPIVWCYNPHAVWALNALDYSTVLYHMVDDLSAVPGAESIALRQAEALLLQRASHVVCTELELFRYARRYHHSPVLMENVADFHHFHDADPARVSPEAKRIRDRIRALPAPRILFSGHLAPHKVDFDLLLDIKRRRPGWSLVLIGPQWEGADAPEALSRLKAEPGVVLAGRADYNDLPALLGEADALIIPYLINDVTRHVSPLKFFEYLATGRPIVATPLPSILRYAQVAGLASDAAGFVAEIERALADPDAGRSLRIAIARRQTWEQRIEEIGELLQAN